MADNQVRLSDLDPEPSLSTVWSVTINVRRGPPHTSFIAAHSIAERKAIVKSLQPYYSINLLTVFARQFDTTHSATPAAREEVCVCCIVRLYHHLSGSCFRGANAV
jgi:hypothetical protein